MEQRRKASPVCVSANRNQNPMVFCFNLFNFGLILPYPASYVMNNFFVYYPDTTLPPTVYAHGDPVGMGVSECSPRLGAQGSWRKGESWQGFVGFNGLLWNIVVLNQPNANIMPISQKHWASQVNRPSCSKLPQIAQIMTLFCITEFPSTTPALTQTPAYMPHITRTHAFPHNARCTPHIPHTHVTQHNPNGINLHHLPKSLDTLVTPFRDNLN